MVGHKLHGVEDVVCLQFPSCTGKHKRKLHGDAEREKLAAIKLMN